MDTRQFRDFIVRPALQQINAWTLNAEQLVMATAMAESNMFFIQQIGNGPACGFFQMEPATHDDIWERYLSRKPTLLNDLKTLIMRDMDFDPPPIKESTPDSEFAIPNGLFIGGILHGKEASYGGADHR